MPLSIPHPTRLRLARRLALLSAASSLLFPASAVAQEFTGGVGAFIGFGFGRREGIEWGFEAFGITPFDGRFHQCSADRAGFGPLVQFGLIDLGDPRFTFALHGGKLFERGVALTGELGITQRFGSAPGWGMHVGVTPEWAFFNASLRGQFFLEQGALVAGARVLPTYGLPKACGVGGRPLRGKGGQLAARKEAQRGAPCCDPRDDRSLRAGSAWERDAQDECASVPAFLQLAGELLVHDAPSSLVEQALDAAEDEIVHARLCAEVASALLGVRVRPALPAFSGRPLLGDSDGLIQFAAESWLDGCLNEGAAAERAAQGAELAGDSAIGQVQTRIFADEHRHAELGWQILSWALQRGGANVVSSVYGLRNAEFPGVGFSRDDDLGPYGRVSKGKADAIFDAHAGRCRHRLDKLLRIAESPQLVGSG